MMQTLNEAESDSEMRYWIQYITKIFPFYLHSSHINLDAITIYTAISLKFVSNLLIIIPVFILRLKFFFVSPTDLPSYSHDFQFHFCVLHVPDQFYIIGHWCFIIYYSMVSAICFSPDVIVSLRSRQRASKTVFIYCGNQCIRLYMSLYIFTN
jgi:hypothetical protein